jgi:FKBP-type peptidyl-prolyl cis-trans isomerase FkpA
MMSLEFEDTIVGEGAEATKGSHVRVHYTGKLEDGTVFDSSHKRNAPVEFGLGKGAVIRGWDEGFAGMKIGGKRTLTIGSDYAYGDRGVPGVIPGGATLIFDVELLHVG